MAARRRKHRIADAASTWCCPSARRKDTDDGNDDGNDGDDNDDSTNANHVDGCHLVFQMVRIGIGWIGWMMKVCTFREPDYILMVIVMMSDDDEIECDDEVQITIVTHSE